ncbi:MAG TPA: transporter substrate-binding domain-containing protein [Anaeromyxobacteraceae bacterium]|nr:transporter substrate-binding domain-containing protein [Anaeromyxobacteraceae bacterium]
MARSSLPLALLAAAAAAVAPARASAEGEPDLAVPSQPVVVGGADPDYPPSEFVDREGQPAGYNVDLTRAIAETMGLQVVFHFGKWSEIRGELAAGKVDILQGISWSEARARELEFAPPHAIVQHAIFARNDTPPVSSIDELKGKSVIVFQGGIMDETLSRRGLGDHLVRTGTPADALRLLASGQHDYVALALLPGMHIIRELQLTNVQPVARRIASERYGYAVKKGNSELLARFDEGLAILKKTGRYEAIRAKWLGVLDPPRVRLLTVAKYAAVVVVPLLFVLALVLVWSRSLKELVAQRTASLAREVAERERAVEELRVHQQQLVQAGKMAAVGVLASGVAHEVNNPNGLILLDVPLVKAALEDAQPVLDAHARRDPEFRLAGLPYARMREELPQLLDEVLAASRRIKHIVAELKDFARREDAPRLEPTDLNEAARAAVRLVDASIRRATRRFEAALSEGLPQVRGNPQRLEQVIVNLLLNACQALPDADRKVSLATRLDEARGAVVLEVRDEGRGIAPEHLPRLTEPFFTTKRETGGTGLGLSVSAGIVKEHGGSLEFDSRPGAGTCVTLALPALRRDAA